MEVPLFYVPLRPRLSQGDIISDIPLSIVESPVTICRPLDATKSSGKAEFKPMSEWGEPTIRKNGEFVHLKASRLVSAVVIWHDCQIDKFENQGKKPGKWFAAVAPIVPFTVANMSEDSRDVVRQGKRRAFFHLEAWADAGVSEEGFIDFRHLLPIRQTWLIPRRKGSLSDVVRDSLQAHLFSFLTQRDLPHGVVCSNCGNPITLQMVAPELPDVEGE